jgi:hypothetical protein
MSLHLYKGTEAGLEKDLEETPWLKGCPFMPAEAKEDDGEEDEAAPTADVDDELAAFNTTDFFDAATAAGVPTGREDVEDKDDDDADPRTLNERRRKAIVKCLRALSSPLVLALIRVIGIMIEPLRVAQVKLQNSNPMDPDVTTGFQGAYDSLELLVASEASFKKAIVDGRSIIDAAKMETGDLTLKAEVTVDAATGDITVANLSCISAPVLLAHYTDAAADKAWGKVADAARAPAMAAVKKYMKHGQKAFHIADRRNIAALNVDLKLVALGTELNRENALPKAMRSKAVVVMAAGVEDPLGV